MTTLADPSRGTQASSAWAVRVRRREGFGWAEPRLAGEGLFGWVAKLSPESKAGPAPIALFSTRKAAESLAGRIRSVNLSARPVQVDVEVSGEWA